MRKWEVSISFSEKTNDRDQEINNIGFLPESWKWGLLNIFLGLSNKYTVLAGEREAESQKIFSLN